jgi:hypothetical protein
MMNMTTRQVPVTVSMRALRIGNIIVTLAIAFVFGTGVAHAASANVSAWWPTANAHLTGVQPFKGMVSGLSPAQ